MIERQVPRSKDNNMIFQSKIHMVEDYVRYERRRAFGITQFFSTLGGGMHFLAVFFGIMVFPIA